MGSNSDDGAMSSGSCEAGCSDSTIRIKITTMDFQIHTLRVDKHSTILALKEQIVTVTGVPPQEQRLLYRGSALQNNRLLSAYHVEDGHLLHLVARQQTSSPSERSLASNRATYSASGSSNSQSRQINRDVTGTAGIMRAPAENSSLSHLYPNIAALSYQRIIARRNNDIGTLSTVRQSEPRNLGILICYSRHRPDHAFAAFRIQHTIVLEPPAISFVVAGPSRIPSSRSPPNHTMTQGSDIEDDPDPQSPRSPLSP